MSEKPEEGITVKKENFSEWFSQVVFKTKLIDIRYGLRGFPVHREWGVKILRRIYEMFEEELEKTGHEPVLFPSAIPSRFMEREKEHVEGFTPEVFWVTRAGNEDLAEPFVLRPTSETAFYSMYSLWIRSWRDLPFKRYQSRITVFRYESQTRPYLRGREFPFFETHCAFRTREEALEQIRSDMEIMKKVCSRLSVPFLFLKRPEWDKFPGAEDTYAAECVMPDGKVSQIGTTHDLGQKFSRAFDVKFREEDGTERYAWLTCFGPGVGRLAAAVVGIHGDDTGLVLPSCVAPYQCVIVPIYFSGRETEVLEYSREVKKRLEEAGIRVFLDDSEEKTPGYKFNHWEMMGVPLRIEIGPREAEQRTATLVRRVDRKKSVTTFDDLTKSVIEKLGENDSLIRERSERYHSVREVGDFETLERIAETGGFFKAPFCSVGSEGEACARELQERTALKVRGTVEGEERAEGNCIICGKPAGVKVYLAKAY